MGSVTIEVLTNWASAVAESKIDTNYVVECSLNDLPDDVTYWLTKTPAERWQAMELLRQVLYGYDQSTPGLQRIIEVVERI